MKKRMKKAAAAAIFGYISVVGFGFGMLKAAQQTRRTLYGGTPVLAQITHPIPDSGQTKIILGGGEWTFSVQEPQLSGAAKAAEKLPPSAGKILLRLAVLSDYAADYTADLIKDEYS